ncbi:MAG: hypothetical protein LBT37_07550 [Lactobacillaceae bacterium]|nr:hypothetical protein [Lactobacillaceae bacterium]
MIFVVAVLILKNRIRNIEKVAKKVFEKRIAKFPQKILISGSGQTKLVKILKMIKMDDYLLMQVRDYQPEKNASNKSYYKILRKIDDPKRYDELVNFFIQGIAKHWPTRMLSKHLYSGLTTENLNEAKQK